MACQRCSPSTMRPGTMTCSGSSQTLHANSKETLCLARLARAFVGSHSNRIESLDTYIFVHTSTAPCQLRVRCLRVARVLCGTTTRPPVGGPLLPTEGLTPISSECESS